MLGGRVVGYTLKPFVLWHRENPRAFKRLLRTRCQCCRSSKKARAAQPLFPGALRKCCVSKTEGCCLEKNTLLKILLIVDNAPGHPQFIGDVHPNLRVGSLSPVDRGVRVAFEASSVRRTFA